MPERKFSRRNLLQVGLAAGTGVALWELYRLGFSNKIDRNTASLQAFKETGLDQDQLQKLTWGVRPGFMLSPASRAKNNAGT